MINYLPSNLNYSIDLNILKYPISVYLKVTSDCMLKCNFCSQNTNGDSNMDFEFAKRTLDDLKKKGISCIYYTGGEPLLYRNLVEIAKYGKRLGFIQILVTNGLLLKSSKILDYFDCVGISIHGTEQTHDILTGSCGSHKEVIKNIKFIQEKYPNININVNCTLVEENDTSEDLEFIVNFCKAKNIKLYFGRLNYIGKAVNFEKKDINKYLNKIIELRKDYQDIYMSNCIVPCVVEEKLRFMLHSCGAGVSIAAIEANGDLKICPTSNYVLGNLKTDNFEKVWSNKKLKKFRELKWLSPICKGCKNLFVCKGGCHAEGNGEFWNNNCDDLFLNRIENVWEKLSDSILILKVKKIKRENKNYIILSYPIKITNKIGFKIIKEIDGKKTGKDIEELFLKEKKVRDYLIALYNDGVLEVNDEKKKN